MTAEPEPRFDVDLTVRAFGMDADGRPFSQTARVLNICTHGCKLSALGQLLKPGDTIALQFETKKTRCKVIWVADSKAAQKIEAGLQIAESQPSPWDETIKTLIAMAIAPAVRVPSSARDKRKFRRHRLPFPLEIQAQGSGFLLSTQAADISGRGCYIESAAPLPVNTILKVNFSLNSQPIKTSAIVRTSDGGVGMGIEFTGLDDSTQKNIQRQIEFLLEGLSPLAKAHYAT